MNEQLPLEQIITHRREPFQSFFATRARDWVPASDDYLLEPASEGLRLQAANELALERPADILGDAFGDEITFMPVQIKTKRHGNLNFEPIMFVRTEVRPGVQPGVRSALLAHGAAILEEDEQPMRVMTRALAPLRNLLGFPQVVRKVAGNPSNVWTWLSHYAPLDPDGGGKAA